VILRPDVEALENLPADGPQQRHLVRHVLLPVVHHRVQLEQDAALH
jgi:hypothetical protein